MKRRDADKPNIVILPNRFDDKPLADALNCIGEARHETLKTEARDKGWTQERLNAEIRTLADEVLSQVVAKNDAFRKRLFIRDAKAAQTEGLHHMTRGVHFLPDPDKALVLFAVRDFDDFSEGDDPYGEHDFGAIALPNIPKVYWKIDYYEDAKMAVGTDDRVTAYRVLTIMLADEY